MTQTLLRRLIPLALTIAVLAACSRETAPAVPAAPQNSAAAERDLAAYRKLVAANSLEIATTMGREILRKHPGSPAAAEVSKTLADVELRWKTAKDTLRLAALWAYQSTEAQGGKQESATIYSSVPGSERERVRLILRRHADWGQSVYVFSHGKGFKCGNACTVTLGFDGKREPWQAFAPETGEPAIFIKDDVKFLARLPGVRKLDIEATHHDLGPTTFEFEVGGYVPQNFRQL